MSDFKIDIKTPKNEGEIFINMPAPDECDVNTSTLFQATSHVASYVGYMGTSVSKNILWIIRDTITNRSDDASHNL